MTKISLKSLKLSTQFRPVSIKRENSNSSNVRGSLNHDIFSSTHTLSLSNLILKSQCVGGAKDFMV